MSDLDTRPREQRVGAPETGGAEQLLITGRRVPLGKTTEVMRALPDRQVRMIGAWCFLDHYGPEDLGDGPGMRVWAHPHTGLQTVSWLFSGEVEHRDSLGTHRLVRPGELNLMTAGYGISHSEDSTPDTRVLHGVQLWTALPERHRGTAPAFQHYVPSVVELEDGTVRVFLGSLAGSTSPVATFSPLVGAEVVLGGGFGHTFTVDPSFEHGVLVDTGTVEVDGVRGAQDELLYLPPGAGSLTLRAVDGDARVVLVGGQPLGEAIVMWWNFIGRDHDEIVRAREDWEAGRRFGTVDHPAGPLPAPALPTTRLRPRPGRRG